MLDVSPRAREEQTMTAFTRESDARGYPFVLTFWGGFRGERTLEQREIDADDTYLSERERRYVANG